MLVWWNGRRVGLKIRCRWLHVGSSPTTSTKKSYPMGCDFFYCNIGTWIWRKLRQQFVRRTKQSSELFVGYGRHRTEVPPPAPKSRIQWGATFFIVLVHCFPPLWWNTSLRYVAFASLGWGQTGRLKIRCRWLHVGDGIAIVNYFVWVGFNPYSVTSFLARPTTTKEILLGNI